MGEELGLSKWLEMSETERARYLSDAERTRTLQLQKLSYEEALNKTHELLKLAQDLPMPPHQPPSSGLTP